MPLIAASISLRLVGLLDVVVANLLEHVAEQIELAIGVGGGGESALASMQAERAGAMPAAMAPIATPNAK